MRRYLLPILVLLWPGAEALAARKSLSYLKAHNFRISSAESAEDWLLVNPLEARSAFKLSAFFSRHPEVHGLYSDLKSKNIGLVQSRLQQSYGQPFDAVAKVHFRWHHGRFAQSFSLNAGAAMLVNDPVFPELAGILFNDYTFSSSYRFALPFGITARPILSYGLRRVMEQSFSVGQLLGEKPNLKIKTYPYKFFAELGLKAYRPFSWGELLVEASSLPIRQESYDYWEVELGYRSPNLTKGVPWLMRSQAWASFSPLYGGTYELSRTAKIGVSLEWIRFLQTDFFLAEGFRPAGILRLGTPQLNLQAFTFARAEDDTHFFQSRQYGLALSGAF